MSNFICANCGAECIDTDRGYITGCEHYPADQVLRGTSRHLASGVDGAKRFTVNDDHFDKEGIK